MCAAASRRCMHVNHVHVIDMCAATMTLTLCFVSVACRLSVEGDVLSIKVENKEAPVPDAAPNAAADDGDFAMVSAEGEHGPNGGANGSAEGANDGEGASVSAEVKCARLPFSSLPCMPIRCSSYYDMYPRCPATATLFQVLCSRLLGCLLAHDRHCMSDRNRVLT